MTHRPAVAGIALAALLPLCMQASARTPFVPSALPQVACESLAALTLPGTTITLVQALPAGANAAPVGTIPRAICRVAGTVAPQIKFEVWLPSTGDWNGKFQGVGNGGLAGNIGYNALRAALVSGYATASTDTGHVDGDIGWFTDLQQTIDNGHRGIHEMTVKAKSIIGAYYGEPARLSYFNGCSTGGGQGFHEVQRYPADYDGVLSGAPNWQPTRNRGGSHIGAWVVTHRNPASTLSAAQLPVIGNAVLAKCDALDGVTDGVLEDPRRCNWNATELLCRRGQDPATCLSKPQTEAVQTLYFGTRFPSNGQLIFPGYSRGTEFGWGIRTGGATPTAAGYDFYRYAVLRDPTFDFRNFDFDLHVGLADSIYGPILNADSPDIRPFTQRGGKLLLYHGWADPQIPANSTVDYYGRMLDFYAQPGDPAPVAGFNQAALARVQEFARAFFIPGMGHCAGGPGTDTFDGMAALEAWVEQGRPPTSIPAAHLTNGIVDKTRPLCLYPTVATYTGSGSTNDAANFVCRAP